MYPTSGATIRADINTKVEEAANADEMFIGLRAMPPLPVAAKSGTYPKIAIAAGDLLTPLASERTSTGSYGEVSRQWTTDTYDCIDYGLESAVGDVDQADMSRFFNLEVSEANWVRRNVQLAHEARVAAALMNATTFGAGTNSTVAYTAANIATIDFPLDVLAAIARVKNNGVRPNTIILNEAVAFRLAVSTKVQSWVRGSLTGQLDTPINAANLAKSFADFGITQVLIGDARYNSAKKGQAKSMAAVWGVTYVWVGSCNAGAGIPQEGGAGFTLNWQAEGGIFTTETYRDEKRRSNMVRVRQNVIEKVTDATAGTLITTQYS
jgi:hypothetical protein